MFLLTPKKQTGFSLIELVTVLLIITVLSTIAIRSTVDIGYSARYEQTRDRLETIQQGILGNPNRFVNGQPDIGGFIENMGRLPDNVRELFQTGYCAASPSAPNPPTASSHIDNARRPNTCTGGTLEWRWLDSFCTDGVATTKATCTGIHLWLGKDSDASTGLIFGWQGPYLSISGNPGNSDAYTDGWGRESSDDNYGWIFSSTGSPDLTLQSYGKDQQVNGSDYDADYPNVATVLSSGDWQRNLEGINVNIRANFNGSCGSPTCSNPNYTLQTSCESENKTWESLVPTGCLVPIYPDQPSCESIITNTWNSTESRCEDARFTTQASCESMNNIWAIPTSKFNCETGGGTWTIATATICIKVFYKSVDTNGKTIIATTNPLVGPSHNILEDGQEHLKSFTGLFEDKNNDGNQDVGELNISTPVGQIALGVYEFTGGICTTTRYKGLAADEVTTLYPSPNNLPVVNW